MTDDYNRIFADKNKILVVTAHPDDAEIMCGGLICKLTSEGKEVSLVVTTNGGKGYQGREDTTESEFANLRKGEQEAAATIMGIKKENNFNLDFPDGEIDDSYINIGKIVWHIRRFQPDIEFEVGDFVAQKTKALSEHKNAIAADHVEGYIEDFRQEDGSYIEKMKWFKVY